MKRIAIFVSGNGEAAERIVKLFNEGNRLRTELVVTDDSAASLLERLKDEDVIVLHIPDGEWEAKRDDIADIIREKDIDMLVLDDFALAIPDEIMETTEGRMIRVSNAAEAPREVVATLEADFRKPVEEKPVEEEKEDNTPPTPEKEWASALNIQFTPPKVPQTPPDLPKVEIPVDEIKEIDVLPENPENPEAGDRGYTPHDQGYPHHHGYSQQNPGYFYDNQRREREDNHRREPEPMPSTWLIWSVLVTVFCCFIPGIIAIIFSSQVSSKYYAGDYEGARRSSRLAEIWIIVSFVLGVLTATLYVPLMMIG